jgi:transcriptional regulator with XRE-family HTH domain
VRTVHAGRPKVEASALVREARVRAGMTQAELAVRANVTQSVISTYENGRRDPSLAMLQRLLAAAGFVASMDLLPCDSSPTLRSRIDRHRAEIVRGCAALGGRNLLLVGEVARGEEHDTSVVELLVDLDDERGVFALMQMQDLVERSIGGSAAVSTIDAYDPWDRASLMRGAVRL